MNLFKEILSGGNPPQEINVVIEVPKGSSNKYEYNEEKGYFELDRTLYSPLFFPFSYGFIPQTRSEDGDSLDVVLLSTFPVSPGCLVAARPIGLLVMEDEAGEDNKIIAVPQGKIDPRFKEIQDIQDLPDHLRKEIKEFFEAYKRLEPGKFVKLKGWEKAEKAKEVIKKAIQNYGSENK